MLIAGIMVIVGIAGCGQENKLSGKRFFATSISESRGAVSPAEAPRSFELQFNDDHISWSHCNMTGGEVKITPTEIEVGEVESTRWPCPQGEGEFPRDEGDKWVRDFMFEDPEWRLDGSKLTLTTDRAVVELKEHGRGGAFLGLLLLPATR